MAGIKTKSHKPHGKLGNPNPIQPEAFKEQQKGFNDYEEPLAKNPISTKFPISVDEVLRAMPPGDRVKLIRDAVISALDMDIKKIA